VLVTIEAVGHSPTKVRLASAFQGLGETLQLHPALLASSYIH
jgi:hypothetical protein